MLAKFSPHMLIWILVFVFQCRPEVLHPKDQVDQRGVDDETQTEMLREIT